LNEIGGITGIADQDAAAGVSAQACGAKDTANKPRALLDFRLGRLRRDPVTELTCARSTSDMYGT
jgi:hypothetical protein